MRLLIGTHMLLWAAANSKRSSREARALLEPLTLVTNDAILARYSVGVSLV